MEALATVTCIAFILLMIWILWGAYQQQVAGIEANKQYAMYNQQAARSEAILDKSEELLTKQLELHERHVALLSRAEQLVTKLEQKLSSNCHE